MSTGPPSENLSRLPDEMPTFTLLRATQAAGPRLGRLALPARKALDTPHYIASTSRGVIPHLSPDNLRSKTSVGGLYIALEDFVEKAPQAVPPVYQYKPPDNSSPLRCFCALPDDVLIVLGARRAPPIPCPKANSNTAVGIWTSMGFREVEVGDFVAGVKHLEPDIVVGLADVVHDGPKPSAKRVENMGDRTGAWMRALVEARPSARIFAPVLPVEAERQGAYLDQLREDDMRESIAGLAVYDDDTVPYLPAHLAPLARLSLASPPTPQALLHSISLGLDLFTVPFPPSSTDAGMALTFTFPPPSAAPNSPSTPLSLAIDLHSPNHATSLLPLSPACPCYTCTTLHRAYITHLLAANEMLAWTLLQIHNHVVMDAFFAGVRDSIRQGRFEEDRLRFGLVYEAEMVMQKGRGPRARGYNFKTLKGEEAVKGGRNPVAWRAYGAEGAVRNAVLVPEG